MEHESKQPQTSVNDCDPLRDESGRADRECLARAAAWARSAFPNANQVHKTVSTILRYLSTEQADQESYGSNDIEPDAIFRYVDNHLSDYPEWDRTGYPSNPNAAAKKACELLASKQEALDCTLADAGFNKSPSLRYQPGGGKSNKSLVYLEWKAITPNEFSQSGSTHVRFDVTDSTDPGWLVSALIWPLTRQSILTRVLYLVPLLAVLAYCVLVSALMILTNQLDSALTNGALLTIIGTFLLLMSAWRVVSPFFLALEYRWAALPMLFQSDERDLVLAFRRHDGTRLSTLRVQRYTARCAYCGSTLRVRRKPGGKSHQLRGICEAAPLQHQAFFEPVSRTGHMLPID